MQPIIKLELKPKQRLFLSSYLKQSLKILSLPLLDLKELIEEELKNNPFLEKLEQPPYLPQSFGSSRTNNFEKFSLQELPYKDSLTEHLSRQARLVFSTNDLKNALFLIGSLNEKGFLDENLQDIQKEMQISKEKLLTVLETVQTFDPPGIAALNLQSSFLSQLKEKNKTCSLAYKIIQDHFDLFLHNQKKQLAKIYQVPLSEIEQEFFHNLKKLNANPAARFQKTVFENKLIDLRIEYEKKHFLIFLKQDSLPTLRLNRRYLNLLIDQELQEQKKITPSEKKILKKHFFTARLFLKQLKQRDDLLKKLALLLIKEQRGYLLGQSKLLPFSLKELAQKLNLSLSSAYRLLKDKHLLSPRGLEPLKNLFSLPVKNSSISKNSASDLLKKLISEEDKAKPLSDADLTRRLTSLGICWKRRTVTKYRQKLKIASSHFRKKSLQAK